MQLSGNTAFNPTKSRDLQYRQGDIGSPHQQQTLSIMYLGNTSPPAGTLTHRTLEGLYLWGSPQIAGPLAGNSVALKYRHWCDVLLSSALVSELFYVVDFFLLMVPVLSCTVPI